MGILTKNVQENREVIVPTPACLEVESLSDLVAAVGEDLVLNKAMAQILIDLRSRVRSMLGAKIKDESGAEVDFKFTDDQILAEDWINWIPTLTVRKSEEDKASEILSKFQNNPEQLKAILARAGIKLA